MVQSMTGYGKAECICGHNKITIEIKSVNGKGADISLKTQIIPRDKEIEIRQLITEKLTRGNIDLYANCENITETGSRVINREVFTSYLNQTEAILSLSGLKADISALVPAILKLPDVIDNQKAEVDESLRAENWEKIRSTILEALQMHIEFRQTEGKKLVEEILGRVANILENLDHVSGFEEERISNIKDRLRSKIDEFVNQADNNRFEQEIIYYLEKLDITEERVRLIQHCKYFTETLESENQQGKKLGFIAQEMGREINTLGSKANHAQIQKFVVQMKDELEKIKEQLLNLA